MAVEEIIKNSKETIMVILTWFSWILANYVNKIRKWEKTSLGLFLIHFFLSWFVWWMAYLILSEIIDWVKLWFMMWLVCYWAVKIIDALDMITAKSIYNLFMDYIRFKIWKGK